MNSEAAARAPGAVGKAKKKASPCVSTSTPPFPVHASRIDCPVIGERSCVLLRAELVQQRRRALDVGEEEGDGAGRKLGSHDGIIRRYATTGQDARLKRHSRTLGQPVILSPESAATGRDLSSGG